MKGDEPILVLEEVRAGRQVRDDAPTGYSLELFGGEIVVVAGAAGSEKSELLQVAAGLSRPRQGKAMIFGMDVEKLRYTDDPLLRRRTAFVFQEPIFIQSLTTTENIQLPLRYDGDMDNDAIARRTGDVFEAAALPAPIEDVFDKLSPMERRKAGLARAWIREPSVVFYDEPARGLDPVHQRRIFELIHLYHSRRAEQGRACSALIACNDPRPALAYADRFFILSEGTLTLGVDKNKIRSRLEQIEKEYFESIRPM